MANLLEGMDAYKAGIHDLKLAELRTNERCLKVRRDYAQTLREELDHLCQLRIDRGELPKPIEATIEAA